jgi:Domain of unknown function (DUF4217)
MLTDACAYIHTTCKRTQQEHQCQFIFRFAALDLGAVATGFALLRLPKMAELKGAPPASFKADAQDDTAAIEFKDKRREKARQARLVVQAAENKQVLLTLLILLLTNTITLYSYKYVALLLMLLLLVLVLPLLVPAAATTAKVRVRLECCYSATAASMRSVA